MWIPQDNCQNAKKRRNRERVEEREQARWIARQISQSVSQSIDDGSKEIEMDAMDGWERRKVLIKNINLLCGTSK